MVPTMALGVQQLKKSMPPKVVYEDLDDIQQFLDRFYMSRIGIRMLIGEFIEHFTDIFEYSGCLKLLV